MSLKRLIGLLASILTLNAVAEPDEITLSAQAIKQADIQTQPIQVAPSSAEFQSYGMVLNLSPLLELRQQWQLNRVQQAAAIARQQASQQSLKRNEQLFQQDVVSQRQLQEQRAQFLQDQATASGNSYQQQALLSTARLQWGEKMTQWALQSEQSTLEPWLKGKIQLLQVIVPNNKSLSQDTKTIWVDPQGKRQQAMPAQLIEDTQLIDPVTQGRRYFFKVENQNWAIGSQLSAWIGDGKSSGDAVWLPESSVVWQQGQAWVFIASDAQHFHRYAVNQPQRQGQGYRAGAPLHLGQAIVTQGAQTLLSQMLKSQNTHGDEDED